MLSGWEGFAAWGDRPMRRYALRDDQWERIENLLPDAPGMWA